MKLDLKKTYLKLVNDDVIKPHTAAGQQLSVFMSEAEIYRGSPAGYYKNRLTHCHWTVSLRLQGLALGVKPCEG